jgi:hypothetical protein
MNQDTEYVTFIINKQDRMRFKFRNEQLYLADNHCLRDSGNSQVVEKQSFACSLVVLALPALLYHPQVRGQSQSQGHNRFHLGRTSLNLRSQQLLIQSWQN